MSLALFLAAGVGGAAATYFYDDDAPLLARLAVGGPLGLAILGLAGFAAALVFGLGQAAMTAGVLAALSPLAAFADPVRRIRLGTDMRGAISGPWPARLAAIFFYVVSAALVGQVTERAALFEHESIATGVDHNLGDLPFHLGIISGFTYGGNVPPEHPELAGARLTYPFVIDFVAAMAVKAGGSLRSALSFEGLILGLCLVALLHRWARLLTRDRLAGFISPVLFLLNGGMGWTLLFEDVNPREGGLVSLLGHLPHNYTILSAGGLRWGNVVTTLLVPQRTLLLGLPLAVAVATLWWQSLDEEHPEVGAARARRRLAGAGVIAGLLPLVHGHSFAVVMAAGACLTLLFPRRAWAWFFVPAVALALPQVIWIAAGSAVRARGFVGWHFGWDHGDDNAILFWLRNTGLFIPLLVAALAWRRDGARLVPRRLARFYVPFALCFVVPNVLQLSPWIWDNVKFLVYWLVASTPLVASLLAHWWRRGGAWRGASAASLALLTLAGGLDVWRVVSRAERHVIFDSASVEFADRLRAATPPRALVLHVPTYRAPVFLAGRRSLLGYPGHIWSQGLDAGTREADIARMYAGGPDAADLMRRYGVDYVMFGPEERAAIPEADLSRYRLVLADARYRLYDVGSSHGDP